MAFLWTGSRSDTAGLGKLKRANIPVFYTPDTLARGLRRLLDYHAWRDRRLADGFAEAPTLSAEQHQAIARLRAAGRTTLSESESKQLIAAWGVDVTREVLASSAEAAVKAAESLGYPVALKVDSPDILHKTEAGVVRLGVQSAEEVRRAYTEIMASAARPCPGGDRLRRAGARDGGRRGRGHHRRLLRRAARTDVAVRDGRGDGGGIQRRCPAALSRDRVRELWP